MTDISDAPKARADRRDKSIAAAPNFDLLAGVSLRVSVEVGSTSMTLAELLAIDEGSVIELDRAATRELRENQRATLRALQRWPGIETRYRRLVDAAIAQRPKLEKLPPAEAAHERLLRQALHAPGSVAALPPLPPKAKTTQPVLLWLSNFRGAQQGGLTGMGSGAESAEAGQSKPGRDSSEQASIRARMPVSSHRRFFSQGAQRPASER